MSTLRFWAVVAALFHLEGLLLLNLLRSLQSHMCTSLPSAPHPGPGGRPAAACLGRAVQPPLQADRSEEEVHVGGRSSSSSSAAQTRSCRPLSRHLNTMFLRVNRLHTHVRAHEHTHASHLAAARSGVGGSLAVKKQMSKTSVASTGGERLEETLFQTPNALRQMRLSLNGVWVNASAGGKFPPPT